MTWLTSQKVIFNARPLTSFSQATFLSLMYPQDVYSCYLTTDRDQKSFLFVFLSYIPFCSVNGNTSMGWLNWQWHINVWLSVIAVFTLNMHEILLTTWTFVWGKYLLFGNGSISEGQIKFWCWHFKLGWASVESNQRFERPSTSRTPKNVYTPSG